MSGINVDMNSAWCELRALCACQYVPLSLLPLPPNLTVCAQHVKLNSSLYFVGNLIFLLSYDLANCRVSSPYLDTGVTYDHQPSSFGH